MKEKLISKTIPDSLVGMMVEMGADLAAARRARRITQEDMASRITVSRSTYARMENGDPTVSMGAYAMAAWVMGLESRFLSGFSSEQDPVFHREARLSLPDRVRVAEGDMDLDF